MPNTLLALKFKARHNVELMPYQRKQETGARWDSVYFDV